MKVVHPASFAVKHALFSSKYTCIRKRQAPSSKNTCGRRRLFIEFYFHQRILFQYCLGEPFVGEPFVVNLLSWALCREPFVVNLLSWTLCREPFVREHFVVEPFVVNLLSWHHIIEIEKYLHLIRHPAIWTLPFKNLIIIKNRRQPICNYTIFRANGHWQQPLHVFSAVYRARSIIPRVGLLYRSLLPPGQP